jgi:hypothetical protein
MRRQMLFVLLLSVFGGLTASFALGQDSFNPATACSSVTSSGNAHFGKISRFTAGCNIEATSITEIAGKVGIGMGAPYTRLNVRGTSSSIPNLQFDPNMVAVFDNGGNATNVYTNVLPSSLGGTDTNYYFAINGAGVGGVRYNVTGDYVALVTDTSPGGVNNEPFVLRERNVGIGTLTPTNLLTLLEGGGPAISDGWSTYSSHRFKTNILPLEGALEKVEQLQGVSYERKTDGKHEIGVVAEEVDRVVPEVVSHDPKTHEAQGVDYSRLAALLIEAVKSEQTEIQSQQAEIQQLKAQIAQLASTQSGQ